MCILTKSEQRKIVKEKLDKMSFFDRSFKSELIVDDIIASGILNSHSHILFYKSLPTEVNIDRLIEFSLSHGKHCYLPRVNGDNMDIVKMPCKMQKGAYGILEPIGENSLDKIDLVIVPVLAVDFLCNRLGKGKGYYDRYFQNNPDCQKVAVAFKEQQLDKINVEPFDVKMDKIFVR